MILVGLGNAGKNITKLFKPHTSLYKIIVLDEDDGISKKEKVEEYDEDPIKLKQRGLSKHDEAMLFVCGSGKVAGASLRVLEALKAFKTTICYIVPDLEFCSQEELRRHRAHFGIMQQYVRSGMVDEMIILDNRVLLETAGTGTVSDYYEKVNYFIYSTFQNLLYCTHTKPDFGRLHIPKNISRISTITIGPFLEDDEKMLFELDNITETCYYINIEEEDLNGDEGTIPRCQQILRNNKSFSRETSYSIWKSSEESHLYAKHYTHFIQET